MKIRTIIVSISIAMAMGSGASADTTIVVIRMPHVVVLGADSMTTYEGVTVTRGTTCKIQSAGGLFYAAAGLASDPKRGFDLQAILDSAMKKEATLEDKIQAAERSIAEQLTKALNRLRTEDPAVYERRVKAQEGNVLALAFVGFKNDESFALMRQFRAVDSHLVSVRVRRESCPGDCSAGFGMFFLGRHKAVEQYMSKRSQNDPQLSLEEAVNQFIELEIRENPQEVGGPIDILRIDKEGPRWIQKKSECPEVR